MAARKRSSLSLAFAWGAIVAALFACTSDDYESDSEDLTEEVLSCEEAVSKLGDCCPKVSSVLSCQDYRYRSTGPDCQGNPQFSEGHTLPSLNLQESKCIRRRSCKDLIDTGVCERALNAYPRGSSVRGESESSAVPTRDGGEAPNICE